MRAIVGQVPIAGTALDALVTSAASELARKRLEDFAVRLAELAGKMEDKLDKSVIESEEWQDLAVRALSAASRTRDEERRQLYAGILLGSATPDWPPELDNEAALSALAELSPTDVRVLAHLLEHPLAEGQPVGSMLGAQTAWSAAIASMPGDLSKNLAFHTKRIERVGFLQEVTGSYVGYGGGVYVFTPTLAQLMNALKAAIGG